MIIRTSKLETNNLAVAPPPSLDLECLSPLPYTKYLFDLCKGLRALHCKVLMKFAMIV